MAITPPPEGVIGPKMTIYVDPRCICRMVKGLEHPLRFELQNTGAIAIDWTRT